MGPVTKLKRLHAEYANDPTPDAGCVEFVFHTFHGFLVFVIVREHRFRLPPDRARELLWRLHLFNMSWGLLAAGMLLLPGISYGSYLSQKCSIREQELELLPYTVIED